MIRFLRVILLAVQLLVASGAAMAQWEVDCGVSTTRLVPTTYADLFNIQADRTGGTVRTLRPFASINHMARCVRGPESDREHYVLVDEGSDGANVFIGNTEERALYLYGYGVTGLVDPNPGWAGTSAQRIHATRDAELERKSLYNQYPYTLADRWALARAAVSNGGEASCARRFVLYKLDYAAIEPEPQLRFTGSLLLLGTEHEQYRDRSTTLREHDYRIRGFNHDDERGLSTWHTIVDFTFGEDTGCY